MEINYYPFDHTFEQVCLMEVELQEKEKNDKIMFRER
jgi:hypothetical protein